jgi:hypothetical protein
MRYVVLEAEIHPKSLAKVEYDEGASFREIGSKYYVEIRCSKPRASDQERRWTEYNNGRRSCCE